MLVTIAGRRGITIQVHVYTYKLMLEPALWSPPALTPESLAERLAGDAVVQELTPLAWSAHPSGAAGAMVTVGLQRDRESHEEALNELLVAVQELGYAIAEPEITRVADRAIEMAFGFGVSGGLGTGSATDKAELALLGAGIGWVVGLLVGANMQKAEVLYRAQWTTAGWHLIAAAPAHPAAPRPALNQA